MTEGIVNRKIKFDSLHQPPDLNEGPVWVDSGTSSSHHATDRLTPHSCYSKHAKFNGMTCWSRPHIVISFHFQRYAQTRIALPLIVLTALRHIDFDKGYRKEHRLTIFVRKQSHGANKYGQYSFVGSRSTLDLFS